ncbi:MAG: hypothetical protein C9356_09210 [Oleiphilus sp.]|nr:MAG: hypothetical protein C9356_09210 [Oleiphilus sp.]
MANIETVTLSPEEALENAIPKRHFDLTLIDFDFKHSSRSEIDGTNLSAITRRHKDTPVYLYSDGLYDTSYAQQPPNMERFVSYSDFANANIIFEEIKNIRALNSSFSNIKLDRVDQNDISSMVKLSRPVLDLFGCPASDERSFVASMPSEIWSLLTKDQSAVPNGGLSPTILTIRWFINSLHGCEGFLLDEPAAARFLGINLEFFNRIKSSLKRFEYKGLFNKSNSKRWWLSKLQSYIYELDKEHEIQSSRDFPVIAARVLGARADDVAECIVCGKEGPEALGRFKHEIDVHPVHFRCSRVQLDNSLQSPFTRPRLIES